MAPGLLGVVALTAFLYRVARCVLPGDSDSATVVLQGQSIDSGHVTLSGWRTLYDSFWTIDAPIYAVGVRVLGLDPRLLYLVPALLGAVVALLGCSLARDRRHGIAGLAAVATVFALLALPTRAWGIWYLHGAMHIGTILYVLVAFVGLRRGRWGRGWTAAVLFFAAGLLGDLQMLVLGVVPALGAGLGAMLRTRNWRAGLPTVSAAAAGGLLAIVLRKGSELVGTYAIGPANPRAGGGQILANLGHAPQWLSWLFGVSNGPFGPGHVATPLLAIRVVGMLTVTLALAAAGVGVVRGAWNGSARGQPLNPASHLDDLLLFACLGDACLFVGLAVSADPAFVRYLVPLVVFGAILAGRMVGRWVAAARVAGASLPLRRAGAVSAAAVLAAYLAAAVSVTVRPQFPVTNADVARFLDAHDLHEGIGSYWAASITTVASGGRVVVRPVSTTDDGEIVRYSKQSTADWYTRHAFQFLIYGDDSAVDGVDAAAALASFGPFARSYAVGRFTVLVWSHPVRLAPDRYAG